MLLTDFESTIYAYLSSKLQEEFPELSTASGSPVTDIFINPLITILKPFIDLVNRVDLIQDLSNAELMTEEELDNIGTNNYGIARKSGARASGYVYVEMNPEYVTEQVILGPITVSTATGLRFSNGVNTIIRYVEGESVDVDGTIVPGVASDYLNTATGKYEFPIYVEAEDVGVAYNVDVGEIDTLITKYPLLNDVVSNKEAFVNGVEKETNLEYATRIKNSLFIKIFGTSKGYRSYIMSNFKNAKDVYVAGYGDPIMTRDSIVVNENGIFVEKNAGGKVDLYIRGSEPNTYEQISYLNSDTIRLINPRLKNNLSIIVRNITNPDNNDLEVALTYEYPDTKTGWVEATVVAGGSGILPSVGDELVFSYISYLDDTFTDTLLYEQTLYYMDNKIRINKPPFTTLTGIYNETKNKDVSFTVNGTNVSSNIYEITRALPIIGRGQCSDTSIVDTEIILDNIYTTRINDFYNGCTIYIIDGTGVGQSAQIASYDASTNTATIDTPWGVLPDTTSKYIIRAAVNKKESSSRDTVDISINSVYSVLIEQAVQTTLAVDVSTLDTSIEITEDVFPAAPFYVKVNDEVMRVTSKSGTTLTVDRAQNFTDVSAHSAGDIVVEMAEENMFTAGDRLKLTYVYNKLVTDIQEDMDIAENRIITTDVLVREALPVYLYFGFKIKCHKGKTIGSTETLALSAAIEDIIQDIGFNEDIQVSDIISILYKNPFITAFLDYIEMPVIFFYSTSPEFYVEYIDGTGEPYLDLLTEEKLLTLEGAEYTKSGVSLSNAEYPVLGMLAATVID